jgi:hypothetical protein
LHFLNGGEDMLYFLYYVVIGFLFASYKVFKLDPEQHERNMAQLPDEIQQQWKKYHLIGPTISFLIVTLLWPIISIGDIFLLLAKGANND